MTEDQLLPIQFEEHAQLQSLGIHAANIGFNTLTMESDKYICVREKNHDQNQVVIIDLSDVNNIIRRPITADSAIMHPIHKIIALKASKQLQMFNIELKAKIKSHVMNEEVVFWKWISEGQIGIVSDTNVYHWDLEGDSSPLKVFERHTSLKGCQIINYRTSVDGHWMLLIGISAQQGRIVGSMQLYSKEKKVSQPIEGHAAAFAEMRFENQSHLTKLFSFAVRTTSGAKLHIVEIDHKEGTPVFPKRAVDIFFPPEAANDFPVAMQISPKYEIIYVVTKYGFIHLYDVETGTCIYMNRISSDTIFVTAEYTSTSGIIGINRKGQVLSISIDESNLVSYLLTNLGNSDLAFRMAARNGLPGADALFIQRFRTLMEQGSYAEAAKTAAQSPGGILRTLQTMEALKSIQSAPGSGQPSPILQYFGVLLEKGDLNKAESLELARPVLLQGKKQLLEKWLKEDKIDCSEELGDLVLPHDPMLALSVYLRANIPSKVIQCFAETGQFSKIPLYAKKVGFEPNYVSLFRMAVSKSPETAVEFAVSLTSENEGKQKLTINQVADIFMAANALPQLTSYLLDVLKENKPEQGSLQTLVLEANLQQAPQVADAILTSGMFSHFDRIHIAALCERGSLLQRALELYTDPADIIRGLSQANQLPPDWILGYCSRLPPELCLDCFRAMLHADFRQNLPLVVQIASKNADRIHPHSLIELFESFKSFEGLYYYLGSILSTSVDAQVHFKYIVAACRTGQFKEAERVCRESESYEPERVRDFLLEARLSDPMPLMIVCDRFGFIRDLVRYLHQQGKQRGLETFLIKVNPERTPAVIGELLDLDGDDGFIQSLLLAVRSPFPIDELVDEVQRRSRLKLLLPWLEARLRDETGKTAPESGLFNALAKIYIDANLNPEAFLRENQNYDPLVIGKYCKDRNPILACLAYERGACDEELLQLTNENGLFKHQARYLLRRRSPQLWQTVLDSINLHRRELLDAVLALVLVEAQDAEQVSVAVRALMSADLISELIELLEKLVLDPTSPFSDLASLQNLLLLASIQAEPSKVNEYIGKLNRFNTTEIATAAVEHGLYEEAFRIYKNVSDHANAVQILIEYLGQLDRAAEYAERHPSSDVFVRLGDGQLKADLIRSAVDSYLRAEDVTRCDRVVQAAVRAGQPEELLRYATYAKSRGVRDPTLEEEVLVAFALTGRLSELESALKSPPSSITANLQSVGERCYSTGCYGGAKLVFSIIGNYSRLTLTLLALHETGAALEAAKKAGSSSVWQAVHMACLDARQVRLAQSAGLAILQSGVDHFGGLVQTYENRGLFKELLALFELAMTNPNPNPNSGSTSSSAPVISIATECGCLMAKYAPERLLDFCKLNWSNCNLSRLIRAVRECQLYRTLVFLLQCDSDPEQALSIMMAHSPDAFDPDTFTSLLLKVSNTELYYKALRFYLDEHPLFLNDLLSSLMNKIDQTRLVSLFRNVEHLPLIRPYLLSAQQLNHEAINGALHTLFIEEENWKELRVSIESYNHFDHSALAAQLSSHPNVEFRRIAAYLYRRNKRWKAAQALLLQDGLYSEALQAVAESKDPGMALDTLLSFIETKNIPCFEECLALCGDYLAPNEVFLHCWKAGLLDHVIPYFCTVLKSTLAKMDRCESEISSLKIKLENAEKQAEATLNASSNASASMYNPSMLLIGGGVPNPSIPFYSMPPQALAMPPTTSSISSSGFQTTTTNGSKSTPSHPNHNY